MSMFAGPGRFLTLLAPLVGVIPTNGRHAQAGDTDSARSISVTVSARPKNWRRDVLSATKIVVAAGETLAFSASGSWHVGVAPVGKQDVDPDGFEALCKCLVSEASNDGHFRGAMGALVGRIGPQGAPFVVGSKKTIQAAESGTLYLGANDNLDPCLGKDEGSCYADNRSVVRVKVTRLAPPTP